MQQGRAHGIDESMNGKRSRGQRQVGRKQPAVGPFKDLALSPPSGSVSVRTLLGHGA